MASELDMQIMWILRFTLYVPLHFDLVADHRQKGCVHVVFLPSPSSGEGVLHREGFHRRTDLLPVEVKLLVGGVWRYNYCRLLLEWCVDIKLANFKLLCF